MSRQQQQKCYVCPARGRFPEFQQADLGDISPLCATHYRTWVFVCQYCYDETGTDRGTYRNEYRIVMCRRCFEKLERGELGNEPHEPDCSRCNNKIKGAGVWATDDAVLQFTCNECQIK